MRLIIFVCTVSAVALFGSVARSDDRPLRELFDRFVAAQNAHDLDAVAALLLHTPEFLWITPAGPAFGHRLLLEWLEDRYQGVWRLEPDSSGFRAAPIASGVAQLQAPVAFTMGRDPDSAQTELMTMTQIVVRSAAGWKIVGLWWQPANSNVEYGVVVLPRQPSQSPARE